MINSVLDGLIKQKEAVESAMLNWEFWGWVFGILVVVGVAGESWVTRAVIKNSRQIQSIQKSIDAESIENAAEEKAKDQAEINQLRAQANQTSQITTALIDRQADRHLSPDAKMFIKQAVSKYAGQKFQVIVPSYGDREANGFAREIELTLKDCGWDGVLLANCPDASQWISIHSGVG